MQVPYSWLKTFLPTDLPPETIAETLTRIGIEVDHMAPGPLRFEGIIVGEVRTLSPHPNADHLRIAEVFDGKNLLPIVCGDPHCKTGMKTALAPIGAALFPENEKKWVIKKAQLRGVVSHGMLCSEKELGLSEKEDAILTVDPEIPAGTSLSSLYGDVIFFLSLTPNLGHCRSILGIARELSIFLDIPLHIPPLPSYEGDFLSETPFDIGSLDPSLVASYRCQLIENCQIAPSPNWLARILQHAGIRPINNVVDVTNYYMLEFGHPLHAFDTGTFTHPTLSVSLTNTSFPLELLDGKTYTIPKETLMVYGGKDPIAVAGVMGSQHSSVQSSSSSILLEAAHFSPNAVRKSSKQLGLRTEASMRFERGVDPAQIDAVLQRATLLIAHLTKGIPSRSPRKKGETDYTPRFVSCTVHRTNQILGTSFSSNQLESFLQRLHMDPKPTTTSSSTFHIQVPSYRNDLHLEIDLIEEIAKIVGYENLPRTKPTIPLHSLPHSPLFLFEQQMRNVLLREGLQEFLTCNLISPLEQEQFAEASMGAKDAISVLKPSSINQSVLRTSLLPSLLSCIQINLHAKRHCMAVFEIGQIHFKKNGAYVERPTLGICITGQQRPHHWSGSSSPVDFFDLKGMIENLFCGLHLRAPSFSSSSFKNLHPNRQASIAIEKIQVGCLGQLSIEKEKELSLKYPLFFAEIDLLDLLQYKETIHQIAPIPIYPESERDWTLSLPPDVSSGKILETIHSVRSKFLKKAVIWDLYQGKELTIRFTYRSDQTTLENEQVEKEHRRILSQVSKSLSLPAPTP